MITPLPPDIQKQIEEVADDYAHRSVKNQDLSMNHWFRQALTEITQPLMVRVEKLEDIIRREAWLENANKENSGIQSPYVGWDDYQKVQDQLTTLQAKVKQMKEAGGNLEINLLDYAITNVDQDALINWREVTKEL